MADIDITDPKNLSYILDQMEKTEAKWQRLQVGMIFLEEEMADPMGGSYFVHEIISIDTKRRIYMAIDKSINTNPIKTHAFLPEYVGFSTEEVFENMRLGVKL